MSLCSYQTLARYDDSGSRRHRARNLDDIRVSQREYLYRARLQSKCRKMLQNRQSLARRVFSEEDFEDEEDEIISPGSPPQCDYSSNWPRCDPSWTSPDYRSTPSPSWSISSSTSSTPSLEHKIPAYFLEHSPPHSVRSRKSKSITNPESRSNTYKPTSQCSSKNPTVANRPNCDPEKLSQDFAALSKQLHQSEQSEISTVVQSNWMTLYYALLSRGTNVCIEAFNLLSSILDQKLVTSNCLMHLLQNGLILALGDFFTLQPNGQVQVIKMLLGINTCYPEVIPYMIELMRGSKIFDDLERSIELGQLSEVKQAINYYYHMSESLMCQICNTDPNHKPIQPLVPQVLLTSTLVKIAKESYSPITTLRRCLTPNLTKLIIQRCIDRTNQKEDELVQMSLVVLANTLRLAHVESLSYSCNADIQELIQEWIVKILCAFRDSDFDDKLNSLIKGLKRLMDVAESSDHCSQGVGIGQMAATTCEHCNQFQAFYNHIYSSLISKHGSLMGPKVTNPTVW